MKRITYNSDSRSFSASTGFLSNLGSKAKSIGRSTLSAGKSIGKNLFSNEDKFKSRRKLWKGAIATDLKNARNSGAGQFLLGSKRAWYNPNRYLKGKYKNDGMVNTVGKVATAVTGDNKYEAGAKVATGAANAAANWGNRNALNVNQYLDLKNKAYN